MTEQQTQLISEILDSISDDKIKEFAIALLDNLPQYIWEVPASSTGKYHPSYSLGQGGLMRHQIGVVKFLNYFFELQQFKNEFTEKEMNLMRVAGLLHDGRKSGQQSDFERNKYTKFNHPILMADEIRSYKGKYLDEDSIEFIAHCIETHMGQWNFDQKSGIVLNTPGDKYQQIVHLADYLGSRKDLIFESLSGSGKYVSEIHKSEDTYDTYVLTFGRHSGEKLIDVWNKDRDYCRWMKENLKRKDVIKFLGELEEKERSELDDLFTK